MNNVNLIKQLKEIFPEGIRIYESNKCIELDINTAVKTKEYEKRMSGFIKRFDYKPYCWFTQDGIQILLNHGDVKRK